MAKVALFCAVILSAAYAPSSQAALIVSGVSLSDNNAGDFISGFSSAQSGYTWTLNLPNFQQSNFSFPAGELGLGVTLTESEPRQNLTSLVITWYGVFQSAGFGEPSVHFEQLANGNSHTGTFSTSPAGDIISFAPAQSVDFTTLLTLSDNGGIAGVSRIRIDAAGVPEPGTISMLALGLALLGACAVVKKESRQ
jgi:hypothetical protein